jgi:hypothetical protein
MNQLLINKDQWREVIGALYKVNRKKGKTFTVNHFNWMNIGRTTYWIIKRVNSIFHWKRGQSRKAIKNEKNKVEKFMRLLTNVLVSHSEKWPKSLKCQTYVAKN